MTSAYGSLRPTPETMACSTIACALRRFSIGAGATYLPLPVLKSSFLRPVTLSKPSAL